MPSLTRWFTICAIVSGCSFGRDPNKPMPMSAGESDASDPTGIVDGDGGGRPSYESRSALVSISLEPELAELESVDGMPVEQAFRVIGTFADGSKQPVAYPGFALDKLDLGNIDDESGVFIANGRLGGETIVRARAQSSAGMVLEAEAVLRVRVSRRIAGDGVPADAADKLAQLPVDDPTRSASLAYPLEGALMPQNAFPADIQWLNGAEGDLFEVSLEKPSASVRVVLRHSGAGFGNHYLVEQAAWRMLATSDADAPVKVRVRRWEAASGALIEGATTEFSFARAALTGSIYYWDIQAGRIVRIDDGTNKAVQFMPTPPMGVAGPGEGPCVGCHAVSPSGRYMAGRLSGGENVGAVFDLTTDLTAAPAPTLFPVKPTYEVTGSARWWFSSWSPDETRLVMSTQGDTAMEWLDPFTGAVVPVTGAPKGNATHPAWSPDGAAIAYVANINTWGGETTAGDIAILPVTAKDTVGAVQIIHSGADLATATPAGNADSYPTWSPDSSRLAFGHGSGSRSDNQQGALYTMGRDGSNVVRLDRACGGVDRTDNFQPRFSPFDSGDYFWLSFLSRRDYGNGEAGTRGKGLQQIWVTAIKKNAAPGEDPSSVAYWVPGQSTASRNISAYWAPRPCRKDGEGCSVGSECCGGDCRPDAAGALVCSPPPPESCRQAGQTCTESPDCCGGLLCEGNVCIYPVL